MKRTIITVITICCVHSVYSGSMGPINNESKEWSGFYLGANGGYWWSQNSLNMTGSPSYINPLFLVTGTSIVDALARVGTNNLSINPNGFIGGGQVGYNYQLKNSFLLGLDVDIDGLASSNSDTRINSFVSLNRFPTEYYDSVLSISKKLNYVGTVRGRLGYLLSPSLLFYSTGGFAYGEITLNETFGLHQIPLRLPSYAPIEVQNNHTKTGIGWTVGGGLEWMFRANWSAKIEGIYYDIGTINNNVTLSQMTFLPIPPAILGSVNVNTSTQFTAAAIRVGVNYHC